HPEFLAIPRPCAHHTHLNHTAHNVCYCRFGVHLVVSIEWLVFSFLFSFVKTQCIASLPFSLLSILYSFFISCLLILDSCFSAAPPSGLKGMPQKKPLRWQRLCKLYFKNIMQ